MHVCEVARHSLFHSLSDRLIVWIDGFAVEGVRVARMPGTGTSRLATGDSAVQVRPGNGRHSIRLWPRDLNYRYRARGICFAVAAMRHGIALGHHLKGNGRRLVVHCPWLRLAQSGRAPLLVSAVLGSNPRPQPEESAICLHAVGLCGRECAGQKRLGHCARAPARNRHRLRARSRTECTR